MTDPQKDEHIEELLGKLQGIFGKLSHSEEEEAKQKIEIPTPAPKEREAPPSAPTMPPPESSPAPLPMYSEPPPASAETSITPESSTAASEPPPGTSAPTSVISTVPGGYETTVPDNDPEKIIVPSAVYFPPGREAEGKSLAQKLETMAPKFTKVAFRLRVGVFPPMIRKATGKKRSSKKLKKPNFKLFLL